MNLLVQHYFKHNIPLLFLVIFWSSAEKADGKELQAIKRRYWDIESQLHYRLDNVLDEDRSRVRNPNAALVLGMFRRVVVSFAIAWCREKKKTKKRLSTRSFLEHLNAENHRRAFDLVTAKAPNAWKN